MPPELTVQVSIDPDVRATFDSFAQPHLDVLLRMRDLILQVGTSLDETGGIEETLKWGEPSY